MDVTICDLGGVTLKSKIEALNFIRLSEKSFLEKTIFILEISLYLLSFISFFYFIILGIKLKAFKCIIIVFLLLGYRFVQVITNIKFHDLLKLSLLIFIFMAMFLAEILNFYSRIPIFDKILHSLSGAMLFFVGQALYKRVEKSQKVIKSNTTVMILFSMFFSIAMAGCWEIFEFSMDRLLGYHLQNDSLFDTMGDIICGTSMAIITAILSFVLFRVKRVNVDKSYMDETHDGYSKLVSNIEPSNLPM